MGWDFRRLAWGCLGRGGFGFSPGVSEGNQNIHRYAAIAYAAIVVGKEFNCCDPC